MVPGRVVYAILPLLIVGSLVLPLALGLPRVIQLAGLFDNEDDEQEIAFRVAVERINNDVSILPRSKLVALVERVAPDDSFHATKKVCGLLKQGIAGVFGPQSDVTSMHVQSICDELDVPHLETRWTFQLQRDKTSINLFPRPSVLSKAFLDLVRAWGWTKFSMVYEDHEGVIRLQDFWKQAPKMGWSVQMYQFPRNQAYRDLFWEIKKTGETKIILDVRRENLHTVLKHAQQVGLMTEHHSYIITSLDLHTVDLEDFKYGKTNITGYRIVDEDGQEMSSVLNDWSALLAKLKRRHSTVPTVLRTESALMYDAVRLFAQALEELDSGKTVDFPPISCETGVQGVDGTSLINYIKPLNTFGLTKRVSFDPQGFRSEFQLDIMHLTTEKLLHIGKWDNRGVNISENVTLGQEKLLQNETIVVTTKISPPYTMLSKSALALKGNEMYEGYGIDLVEQLSKLLGFKYRIKIVDDGLSGKLLDDGTWNGMIGEVIREIADIAVADITITSQREKYVDFTMPFMNTGIQIVFKKPTQKKTSLFSFLSPFSGEVWIYMIAAYVGVSITLFLVGRLSPYEWENPHPCRQNDQVLENSFSLLNSLWFTIGSLMQQGSDLAPRAISTRTIAGIWYFFTLIMISSYTANLAAFLTVEKPIYPFEDAEALSHHTDIHYGCLEAGSTQSFFQESKLPVYQRIWKNMLSFKPSPFVQGTEEGIRRVLNGNYAFFMEGASIDYKIERECNLTKIGGLLDSKSYGIAMKKGSHLKGPLTSAILQLQEGGVLHQLREKWWKQKGGGQCADDAKKSSGSVTELGLGNVGGVFVVLVSGLGLSILVAVVEFIWSAHKSPGEKKSVCKELIKELAFAMSCHGSTKPAPRLNSEEKGSEFRVATIPGFNTEY